METTIGSRSEDVQGADIFDVQTYAVHDGPGIRTTVFMRGCPLRCDWCHNPESWTTPSTGVGTGTGTGATTLDELMTVLLADVAFYEASGGGVTFSGGEPTVHRSFLVAAARRLRDIGVHVAIETCGEFPHGACGELAEVVDLFLFDVKHLDTTIHEDRTGAGVQRILANLARLVELVGTSRIIPRIPVIPGFNATTADIGAIVDHLVHLGFDDQIHLMAYHGWARSKYDELGLAFTGIDPLSEATRAEITSCVEARALVPVWGGGT